MATSPDTSAPAQSGIDCAGARVCVQARSLATLVHVDGEVDAANAELVAQAIDRFSQLDTPLVLDLSSLDFLGIAGFRAVDDLHHEIQPRYIVVTGPALRRLTRVITDHGWSIVDSVPDALQLIERSIRTRRRLLAGMIRAREPQRHIRPA